MNQDHIHQVIYAPSRAKITLVLMILGFMIAIILAIIPEYCLNADLQTHREALQVLSGVYYWVWPTGIMMMATDSADTLDATLVLLTSAAANACLYGLVGLAVGTIWKEVCLYRWKRRSTVRRESNRVRS